MEATLTVLWTVVFLLVLAGFVSVVVLPGWFRARRQEAVWRQIALTEALDGQFGPLVSPRTAERESLPESRIAASAGVMPQLEGQVSEILRWHRVASAEGPATSWALPAGACVSVI